MRLVALGQVARFINGAAFKPGDWGSEGLPIIRIQNLTRTSERFNYTTRTVANDLLVDSGDMLVSWSATLDVFRWNGPRAVLNQHIFKVIPGPEVDPAYLFYALKEIVSELIAKTHGSTMKHVVRSDFESTKIPLPPFEEQRRVADLFDRISSIRRLRRKAQEIARQLIPAVFIKLFGDPTTNPMGWSIKPLGEVIAGFEGGKNLQADSEDAIDGSFQILKVSAVTSGIFRPDEAKPAPKNYSPPPNHFVRVGDVLISRANTAELVGATAFVSEPPNNLLLPDKIWRVLWHSNSAVVPQFLLAWFKQPATRASMSRLASGTSASMRNISQGRLFTIGVIVPPLTLQRQFEQQVAATRTILLRQTEAAAREDLVATALAARLLA